jgi:hypothetical protein
MRRLFAQARLPVVLAVGAATTVLAFHAAGVGIEHDNASLNARDPEQLRIYADFRATFGNDEDLLLTLTYPAERPDQPQRPSRQSFWNFASSPDLPRPSDPAHQLDLPDRRDMPRLLQGEGLALIDTLTRTIGEWDGVARVWSLTTIEELAAGEAGAEPRRLLAPPWDAPDVGLRASAALDRNPELTGWLVSPDRRTAAFVIEIEDRPGDTHYRTRLIGNLRALMAAHQGRAEGDGPRLHLTGVPVQKHDVSAYIDRDQRLLMPLAVGVLGLTLTAFFRRVTGVLIPLGIAGVTVVWTVGTYAWTGRALNAITSLLPPVLLVVAIAASVHIYEMWRAAPTATTDRMDRALGAVRAIAVPAALCAVTTAQGFLSLVMSEIPAVQQFGLFAALGTGVAFVLVMTVAPAVLTWLPPPPAGAAGSHRWTTRMLDATSRLATRRPRLVLAAFTLLTAIAATGIPRIRTNTDLVGFLRAGAPLRRDTAFVDAHLGGTLPLDFVLRRRDGQSLVSLDAYRRLAALEDAIRARPHVTAVTSILALLRQVHRAETGDTAPALPEDPTTLREELDLLDESGHALVRRFAALELRALRLTTRLRAVGTAESAPLIEAVLADAGRLLGPDYTFVPTGALYHVVHDSTRLVREQVSSFGTAIVLVVLAIGLLFRSLAFTVLALVPNVMPIVWTGGLMGFTGIELSTGTAMIASAVLGLVVDDTIYYLSHYRRAYAGDAAAAIRETAHAVGAPVTAASVSLILGFWVGAFGSFRPTIYFSLLTGLTMITGVACDLLVLPALLVLFDRYAARRVRARHGVTTPAV